MSYDIQCWDFTPSSAFDDFDTALKVAFSMEGKPRRLDSRLLEFARAIEQYFLETEQEESVQSHFKNFGVNIGGEATLRFELPSDERLLVFRDIVKIAAKHGIAVLDEQAGMMLLPNGKILPEKASLIWDAMQDEKPASDELPRKISDFRKMLETDFLRLMPDFKKDKLISALSKDTKGYAKSVDDGIRQEIYLGVSGGYPFYSVSVSLSAHCSVISDIVRPYDFSHYEPLMFKISLNDIFLYSDVIGSMGDYRGLLFSIEKYVAGFMGAFHDISSLYQVMINGADTYMANFFQRSSYMATFPVLSWLENDPKLERFLANFDISISKNWKLSKEFPYSIQTASSPQQHIEIHKKWAALKDYLRNHQPPDLANKSGG